MTDACKRYWTHSSELLGAFDTDIPDYDVEVVLATDYAALLQQLEQAQGDRDAIQIRYEASQRAAFGLEKLASDNDIRADQAEANLAIIMTKMQQWIRHYRDCSGNEPSVSLLQRTTDELGTMLLAPYPGKQLIDRAEQAETRIKELEAKLNERH